MRVHPVSGEGSSSVHVDVQPKDDDTPPYWQQVENLVRCHTPQLTDAEIDAYMKQMMMNEQAGIGIVAALLLTMGVQLCMTPRSSFLSQVPVAQIYVFIALSSGTVVFSGMSLMLASLLYFMANKCPPHLLMRMWRNIERLFFTKYAFPFFLLQISAMFLVSATVLGVSLTQGTGYVWVCTAFAVFGGVFLWYVGFACDFAYRQATGVRTV